MRLAIITATGNRTELKEQTLRTLKETLEGVDYEIITKDGMEDGEIKTVNELMNSAREYDYLLRTDDDMFYTDNWFNKMVEILEKPKIELVGGCYYPLHEIIKKEKDYYLTKIAPGNCWLMKRETWDKFGPIRQSDVLEDVDFCRRIRETGKKVAVLKEGLIVHCGITGSRGRGRSEFVTKYMKDLINKVGAKYA